MLGTSKESLLTSFIARVSASPSLTKWTPNFTRMVERCTKSTADRLGPLIVQIEEWVVPPKFENVSVQSQTDLLLLWDCALKFSNERNIQQIHREVVSVLLCSFFCVDQNNTTNSPFYFKKRPLLSSF